MKKPTFKFFFNLWELEQAKISISIGLDVEKQRETQLKPQDSEKKPKLMSNWTLKP